jgi:hypothetical protein
MSQLKDINMHGTYIQLVYVQVIPTLFRSFFLLHKAQPICPFQNKDSI